MAAAQLVFVLSMLPFAASLLATAKQQHAVRSVLSHTHTDEPSDALADSSGFYHGQLGQMLLAPKKINQEPRHKEAANLDNVKDAGPKSFSPSSERLLHDYAAEHKVTEDSEHKATNMDEVSHELGSLNKTVSEEMWQPHEPIVVPHAQKQAKNVQSALSAADTEAQKLQFAVAHDLNELRTEAKEEESAPDSSTDAPRGLEKFAKSVEEVYPEIDPAIKPKTHTLLGDAFRSHEHHGLLDADAVEAIIKEAGVPGDFNWHKFDKDGDDKLSQMEFAAAANAALRLKAPQPPKHLVAKKVVDKKKDKKSEKKTGTDAKFHHEMERVFKKYDAKGNGYLDEDEITKVDKHFGLPKNFAWVNFDHDEDGKLSFEEFYNAALMVKSKYR